MNPYYQHAPGKRSEGISPARTQFPTPHLFSVEQKNCTQGLVLLLSEDGGRYMASEKQVSSSLSSSVLKSRKKKPRSGAIQEQELDAGGTITTRRPEEGSAPSIKSSPYGAKLISSHKQYNWHKAQQNCCFMKKKCRAELPDVFKAAMFCQLLLQTLTAISYYKKSTVGFACLFL